MSGWRDLAVFLDFSDHLSVTDLLHIKISIIEILNCLMSSEFGNLTVNFFVVGFIEIFNT